MHPRPCLQLAAAGSDGDDLNRMTGDVERKKLTLERKQREMEEARYDEQLAAVRSDLEEMGRKMQELRAVRGRGRSHLQLVV
jgi:hypothetical protein